MDPLTMVRIAVSRAFRNLPGSTGSGVDKDGFLHSSIACGIHPSSICVSYVEVCCRVMDIK
jgi:hypothetical protein